MLHKIDYRPECFDNLDEDYDFFSIVSEAGTEEPTAFFASRIAPTKEMFIHLQMHRSISPNALKLLKNTWLEIVDMARFFDVEYLVAVGDPMDEKWPKFLKHFGFEEPKVYAITTQKVGYDG